MYQSGFRKRHSTITASLKVVNNIMESLDHKKPVLLLFIDLSKAFDIVDHHILKQRLLSIGLSRLLAGLKMTSLKGHNVLNLMALQPVYYMSR